MSVRYFSVVLGGGVRGAGEGRRSPLVCHGDVLKHKSFAFLQWRLLRSSGISLLICNLMLILAFLALELKIKLVF